MLAFGRFFIVALLVLCAVLPAGARARGTSETEWMQVLLDGRKIGWMKTVREVGAEHIVTTETLHVRIDRAGTGVSLESEQKSIESLVGQPLGFSARSALSGIGTSVEGEISPAGTIKLKQQLVGAASEQELPWPQGALLAEGLRRLERAQGLAPGTEYTAVAFQPDALMAVSVTSRVTGPERVNLAGHERELVHLTQRIELPGSPLSADLWVDRDFRVQRMQMPMLGVSLDMLACDERCARAPDQPADVLERTLVQAPHALDAVLLGGTARYTLELANADAATLPTTGEQTVRALGDRRFELDIAAHAIAGREPAPEPADSKPTRWLQSDAPELKRLLEQAGSPPAEPGERMQALEKFVRGYIRNKSLRVGYASALETVKSREGDCTEHALLLAALGRAAGIPTRVVNGLAYTAAFDGHANVFVPHAWAQAWVGGRWRSFDAALSGFDAGHVALSYGDGDPSGFYAGVNLLGQVRIATIEPVARQP